MSLELQDLEVMEQIIRICQSRGVFKPEEMVHVGILYKKIVEFLEKNKKGGEAIAASNSTPLGGLGAALGAMGAFAGIGPMSSSGLRGPFMKESGTSMNM
jgi:hypothetical protein